MHVPVLAAVQSFEITPNKLETEIKRNADNVGTDDTCDTRSKQYQCYIAEPPPPPPPKEDLQ